MKNMKSNWWNKIATTQGLNKLLEKDIPSPPLVLDPWLAEREIALLHAPSGVGKTLVAQTLAVAAATGEEALHSKGAGVPTLYVDAEMSEAVFQERVRTICRGLALSEPRGRLDTMQVSACPPEEIDEFPYLDEEQGQERIKDYVRDFAIKLVVIDNLRFLARATDENDASAFSDFNKFLVELAALGTAVIVIHHNNKGGSSGTYSGTTAIESAVSIRIALKSTSASIAGNAAVEVSTEKNRRGVLGPFIGGFKAELHRDSGRWMIKEADTEASLMMFKQRAEAGQYVNQKEAAEAFDVVTKTISRWTEKLKVTHDWNDETWLDCTSKGRRLREIDSPNFDPSAFDEDTDENSDFY